MADSDKQQTEGSKSALPVTQASNPPPHLDEDSDPDFDDLDDVLDQFSANASTQSKPATTQPPPQPTASASESGKSKIIPPVTAEDEPSTPSAQRPGESESDFIERLSKEMSAMFETLSTDPSKTMQSPEDIAKMGKELEEFTHKMEQQGIQPEDLLKAILGEAEGEKIAALAHAEADEQTKSPPLPSSSQPPSTPSASATTTKSTEPTTTTMPSSSKPKPQPKSFEDTIRNTISRLGESDKSATTATQKATTQKSEEDLLADMLRALDAGPGAAGDTSSDEGLSKMFMDMMQQLTHKDLLYEPMKELHTQYPAWLAAHKDKVDAAEFQRYTRQSVIVGEITRKFEEPGFSDDDPACREFIWERMQKMQDEGAPPEELVKNPFPGTEFGGGIPGLGGGGDEQLPEGLSKELEEGCPTQ